MKSLEPGETFRPLKAWISGWKCVHCGCDPKGHGWAERDGEATAFMCPDGTRSEP